MFKKFKYKDFLDLFSKKYLIYNKARRCDHFSSFLFKWVNACLRLQLGARMCRDSCLRATC